MKDILLTVQDALKVKLDLKRAEGYTLKGYINAVLEKALADPPTARRLRKGRRATP
jgi:hypothetical protein